MQAGGVGGSRVTHPRFCRLDVQCRARNFLRVNSVSLSVICGWHNNTACAHAFLARVTVTCCCVAQDCAAVRQFVRWIDQAYPSELRTVNYPKHYSEVHTDVMSPEWRPKSYNKANTNMAIDMQLALVLRPSCVAEKVDVNKKDVNQTRHCHMKPWNRKWLWAVHTNHRQSVHMREMYKQVCLLHYYCVTDINSTRIIYIYIYIYRVRQKNVYTL